MSAKRYPTRFRKYTRQEENRARLVAGVMPVSRPELGKSGGKIAVIIPTSMGAPTGHIGLPPRRSSCSSSPTSSARTEPAARPVQTADLCEPVRVERRPSSAPPVPDG